MGNKGMGRKHKLMGMSLDMKVTQVSPRKPDVSVCTKVPEQTKESREFLLTMDSSTDGTGSKIARAGGVC